MTDPIRILHFADVHIGMERYGRIDAATGVNSRVMDFLRRLSDLVDYAISQSVDLVIFAGDAYKSRNPNSTYRREFAWRIKQLADRGIPVVMLPGNHDLPAAPNRASTIEIFDTLRVANIHVLEHSSGVTRIETARGPVQIAPVPYPYISELTSQESYRAVSLAELDRLITTKLDAIIHDYAATVRQQPDIPAILVGHFSVDEARTGSEHSIMVGRDVKVSRAALVDDAWDYVALGHIHKHQDLNQGAHPPVVYSGSLSRIDFGEEREPKGWVLAQVTRGHTDYDFIPHLHREARRFVTLDCDCRQKDDPLEAILQHIGHKEKLGIIDNAIVRLRLRLTAEQDAMIQERKIKAALSSAFTVAGIIKEIDWGVRSRLGAISIESMTPLELLERYLDISDLPAARQKVLLEEAKTIIQESQ
jgi:exonuclease SbcD